MSRREEEKKNVDKHFLTIAPLAATVGWLGEEGGGRIGRESLSNVPLAAELVNKKLKILIWYIRLEMKAVTCIRLVGIRYLTVHASATKDQVFVCLFVL